MPQATDQFDPAAIKKDFMPISQDRIAIIKWRFAGMLSYEDYRKHGDDDPTSTIRLYGEVVSVDVINDVKQGNTPKRSKKPSFTVADLNNMQNACEVVKDRSHYQNCKFVADGWEF